MSLDILIILVLVGWFAYEFAKDLSKLLGTAFGNTYRLLTQPRKTVRGFLAKGPRIVIGNLVVWGGALLILGHCL